MASIRQRGNRWQVRVSVGKGADGRYVYKEHSVATRQEAQALAASLEDTKRPKPQTTKKATSTAKPKGKSLGTYLNEWLEWKLPKLAPTTQESYRTAVANMAAIHDVPLSSLTAMHVDKLYSDLKAAGLSIYLLRKVHVALSSALTQAVRWGLVESNVTAWTDKPAEPRGEVKPPSVEDVQKLMAAATGNFALFLLLAATTGARRGELAALTWADVDFAAGTITVDKQLDKQGVVRATKTGLTKVIPLDEATLAAVKESYEGQPEKGQLFRWANNGHAVSRRFARTRQRAGVSCRLHDLRHFTATQLLAAGVDVLTVAKRLGHTSPTTTLMIYGHATTEAERQAATVMGGLLSE